MSSQIQAMRSLMQARLPKRIVLWVFLSILGIEVIILLPSIYRRQQELLLNLKNLAATRVEGGLLASAPASDTALLAEIQNLSSSVVKGVALYRSSGEPVGSFGEVPALSVQDVQRNRKAAQYDLLNANYDASWSIPSLTDRYIVIARHDATSVQQELCAFTGRIALLILIISMFVTLVTLIGLERLLITPVLRLRNDLLKVGSAVRQNETASEFESLKLHQPDELGEVITAFDQMYRQVSEAISERRQAEAALRQSEEKFSKAFRASPSAIVISTLETGRLIEVNDSFLQLYGSSLEEVIGKSASELNLWATAEHRQEMIQQICETGAVHNIEYTFRNQQGDPRSILLSAELVHLNGEPCLVSVANDITDRKQAEKALERLAEIGELAAMIVHEVRNPLTTVMMGLKSFQTMELSERYQLRLSLAMEEAERLQRLLNEILQYARCQKIDAVELEINTLIQSMLETLQTMPAARERQIQFTPAHPVRVLGDQDKLKQVFINLISNACEAIEAGDTVWWTLESCNHQQTVCIRIKNGGQPIPSDILPRLTKPFVTTKSTGSGLGLAIVKRIVEAHRGELKLESSEIIGGTEVVVVLPFIPAS